MTASRISADEGVWLCDELPWLEETLRSINDHVGVMERGRVHLFVCPVYRDDLGTYEGDTHLLKHVDVYGAYLWHDRFDPEPWEHWRKRDD